MRTPAPAGAWARACLRLLAHFGDRRALLAASLLAVIASTLPGEARSQITIVSGNNQTAPPGATLPSPLVVSIDCSGVGGTIVPPPCGSVTWSSNVAGDSFSPTISGTSGPVTGATSSTSMTLGPTIGPRIATATSNTLLSSVNFTINALPPAPSCSIAGAPAGPVAPGTSVTLTASCTNSPTSYSWSNGATTSSITVSPLVTTTYSVTATNAGGTSAPASATITVQQPPTCTISGAPSGPVAPATQITLTASCTNNPTAYSWSNGATTPSITVSPFVTTTYTVTASNIGGTSPPASATITVQPRPVCTIVGAPTAPIAAGTQVTLTASCTNNPTRYSWNNGATTASITVAPAATTTYTVTATNAGGASAPASATVAVLTAAAPSCTISGAPTSPVAPATPVTLTARCTNAPTGYQWNTGATTPSITVTPAATTTYQVTASNAAGASAPATATVTVLVAPPVCTIAAFPAGSVAPGTTVTLTANCSGNPTSYLWNTGATTQSITAAPQQTTTYSVTATNAGGTSQPATATVNVVQAPSITVVSGTDQPAIAGTTLASPFVVRVTRGGEALPGATVRWTLTGTGRFTGGETTQTNAAGETSNTLVLGPEAGARTVTVTATTAQGTASTSFTINAGTFAGGTVGADPGAGQVAAVLDQSCARSESLRSLCDRLAALSTGERVSALQQLTPSQYSAPTVVALQGQTTQIRNVDARITALRAGARGFSASGLGFGKVASGSTPDRTMAAPGGARDERGGAASSDAGEGSSRLGGFVNGQGSFGSQDASSRLPGFDFRTYGLTGGLDYRITDSILVGGALGYLRTKSDFDESAGDLGTRGFSVSAFGSYYIASQAYVDGIVTYGRNKYAATRNVAFTGFSASAKGDTRGRQLGASLNAGYHFNRGALTFGPYARLSYLRVRVDGFEESDGGAANLQVGEQRLSSLTTALGGNVSYAISVPWGVLVPQVRLDWEHEYRNGNRTLTGAFVADPARTVFSVATDDPDRNHFNLSLNVSATLAGGKSAFVNYETALGQSGFRNNAFTAGIRIEF